MPAAGKQDTAKVTSTVDSHAVTKRLQSELMSLMPATYPGVSAFPDGDSLFSWVGTIQGAADTVYQGMSYKLSLKFLTDYPFKAPTVKFETPCFHPNIDQYGNICLVILNVHKQVCARNLPSRQLQLHPLLVPQQPSMCVSPSQ